MISYEYLEKAVKQLHALEQKSERFASAIQEFCEDSFAIVNTSYFSFTADLIEKLLAGDTEDNTFTYWLYECNEKYGEIEITNSDGTTKTYKFNSLRDVYNYYAQECWGEEIIMLARDITGCENCPLLKKECPGTWTSNSSGASIEPPCCSWGEETEVYEGMYDSD